MVDLAKARKEKGLTQEQLGDIVGVVRTTISNIEHGIMQPSVQTAKIIANALGFHWTEFYTDSDNTEQSATESIKSKIMLHLDKMDRYSLYIVLGFVGKLSATFASTVAENPKEV